MPKAARSARSKRTRVCLGAAAIGLLAITVMLANPFASRASATTVPIVFPLEKRVKLLHDYLAPRTDHLHQGTDLMAAKMTKEIACVSGTVNIREGTYAGVPSYSIWLAGDDGHGYFYIHINNDTPGTDDGAGGYKYAFAPGLTNGAHVAQGQFIAYVGDSGNAESTAPHLHFEIHQTTSMSSASMDPYDSLAAAPLYDGTPSSEVPPAGATRYEQTDDRIQYLGKWIAFTTTGASGGSYSYADSAGGAIVSFDGTQLDLIATTGVTQGKAEVYLDGEDKGLIDFSSSTTLRKQRVWSTGTVASGVHTVEVRWLGQAGVAGGTRINIDALDVVGALGSTPVSTETTRYEQTDDRIQYLGKWIAFTTTGASGGSYSYADSAGGAIVSFDGTQLDLIATTGVTQGKAEVYLDGEDKGLIDFSSSTTLRKQRVWSTGTVASGVHTVEVRWLGTAGVAGGTRINIDALDVVGALGSTPVSTETTRYEQTDDRIQYLGKWIAFTTTGASGGSYSYADSAGGAIVSFDGTQLDLIATTGVTQGKAEVYLDGEDKGLIDFSSSTTLRKQRVWSTGTVASGVHTVEVRWLGQAGVAGGTRINIDALDVVGALG